MNQRDLKPDMGGLRAKIHEALDFFTEPGKGEKYLKDLEDQLLLLMEEHCASLKKEKSDD